MFRPEMNVQIFCRSWIGSSIRTILTNSVYFLAGSAAGRMPAEIIGDRLPEGLHRYKNSITLIRIPLQRVFTKLKRTAMNLPLAFAWMGELKEQPRHMLKAIELYGIAETPGPQNTPVIMGWAKELKIDYYKADETPWCGLFASIVMARAGRPIAKDPLRALSWAEWGVPVTIPMYGDILTFKRDGGGHVGLYAAEDDQFYYVLGGNQGDKVSISPKRKETLFAARRPPYNNQPADVIVKRIATVSRTEIEASDKVV